MVSRGGRIDDLMGGVVCANAVGNPPTRLFKRIFAQLQIRDFDVLPMMPLRVRQRLVFECLKKMLVVDPPRRIPKLLVVLVDLLGHRQSFSPNCSFLDTLILAPKLDSWALDWFGPRATSVAAPVTPAIRSLPTLF
jgi:hypothetical protein